MALSVPRLSVEASLLRNAFGDRPNLDWSWEPPTSHKLPYLPRCASGGWRPADNWVECRARLGGGSATAELGSNATVGVAPSTLTLGGSVNGAATPLLAETGRPGPCEAMEPPLAGNWALFHACMNLCAKELNQNILARWQPDACRLQRLKR